jgi:hydrogenase expression/formation protein HypC
MCIAFPARIIKIEDTMALVEIEGTVKEVSLELLDEDASVGDYVISHVGFALHKVDEDAAKESLDLLKELIKMEETLTDRKEGL